MKKRIPDDAIIGAIQRWRGNVTAAADALGIAPINLRKRLSGLGVDLSLLRRLKDTGIHGTNRNVPVSTGVPETMFGGRNNSASGIFPRLADRPTLASVSTDAMITRPKALAPIRLGPEQVEKLRDAKFELQYRLRVEVTESTILQQFFADTFEPWLKKRLEQREDETVSREGGK